MFSPNGCNAFAQEGLSMPQGFLNFNLESTDECLTSNAGTILFGEYCKAIGMDRLCDAALPGPGSNRGYSAFEHLFPLLLMQHGGGRVLADRRMIRYDRAMRTLLKITERFPTDDATNKWLGRMGLGGIYGLQGLSRVLLGRYLKKIPDEALVLDIDASVIESHKSTAACTYKSVPGYTPMLAHINGGFVIHSEFRSGNIAPADHNLSFVRQCEAQLPEGKRFAWLRADSASYQADLFNYCDRNAMTFTIGARLDSGVLEAIESLSAWETMRTEAGKTHVLEERVSEFIHTMTRTDNAFRVIVVEKRITPILPQLRRVLDEEQLLMYAKEHYNVIATNADESISAEEIVRFYRQRGDTSENRIKELKNGFNLGYLPTSNFMANAFYFQIGVLAYNLFILFSTMLETGWRRHTIATIRYKLYHLPGKLIRHGRRLVLKVGSEFLDRLRRLRLQIVQAALE